MGGRNPHGFCCFFVPSFVWSHTGLPYTGLSDRWSFLSPRWEFVPFLCFGTEAFFSYSLVLAGPFWLICSCWPRAYLHIFRYRSINFIKLRPWNFFFLTFLWHLPKILATSSRKSCFCGTRMCSNKASVPNSSPPCTRINWFASFFSSSRDVNSSKNPFCT